MRCFQERAACEVNRFQQVIQFVVMLMVCVPGLTPLVSLR